MLSVISRSLALCGVLTLLAMPARAVILFSDNFVNVVPGASIDGRVPTQSGSNGTAWVAITSNFLGNGAGGLSASTPVNNFAALDMGAGYLETNKGVYEISLDITQPAIASPGTSWIGLGFSPTNTAAGNFVTNPGAPWLLYRINGVAAFYAGPAATNSVALGTYATGTAHTFKLQLDTTPLLWTVNAFVDNVQVDLNGASAGMAYAFTSNPTTSHYAAMSTGSNSGNSGTGTVDNFSLSGPVPEPSTALLLLGGLSGLALQRRRLPAK